MSIPRLALSAVLLLAAAGFARAQLPPASAVGPEEFVSTAFMERPSISTDSKGQPHVVCDNGGKTDFMKFHRVNGQWSGGVFAVGSRGGRYSASRLYVGQIEIDPRDRAWISCKFGIKEYGSMYGQGLWLFGNVAKTPNPPELFFRFVNVYKGMGMVATDSKYPDEGVMLGTFGNFERINTTAQTLGKGSMNAGHGGEKVRFRIASYAPRFGAGASPYADGVWHTAMNGFSALDSKYQNNLLYQAGKGPITWASYRLYPEMGDDLVHPGIGIDLSDPRVAYMGCVFNGVVRVNIWNGERMVAPTDNLIAIASGAAREVRHGPAFAPAPGPAGGSFVFWTGSSRIKMAYLSKTGKVSETRDIGAGRSPAATTDRNGHVHLVYWSNGVRYRKITITTLEPIFPKGRITATRTPRFRWTNTRADRYTVEITRDGEKQPLFTVTKNTWTPDNNLPVGAYSWRVKEGWAKAASTWSARQAFIVPPATPAPATPNTRFPEAPVKPLFNWTCDDPATTHFVLELFRGANRIQRLVVPQDETNACTVKWETKLDVGAYQWRIRAIRRHADKKHHVGSEWSPMTAFQVAVPAKVAVTAPADRAQFEPGWQQIRFAWNESDGADFYKMKLLFNGQEIAAANNLDQARHTLSRAWQPGYYSIIVHGRNEDGNGSWSEPLTFIVKRQMFPGNSNTRANPPRTFEWTRQPGADRYRVGLAVYNNQEQKFKKVLNKWVKQPPANAPAWKPGVAFADGAYRWSITDYTGNQAGYTSVDYFQVNVPGRIQPVGPAGPTTGQRELPLRWQDPSGFAEQFQVQLWQGKTRLKNSPWLNSADLAAKGVPEFSRSFNYADDVDTAFAWRVRARNGTGVGPWRQVNFTLTPLDAPVISHPSAAAPVPVGLPGLITWSAVSGATHYQVQVLKNDNTLADHTQPAEDGDFQGFGWTPGVTGTHTVRVRAGRDGWSRWSAVDVSVIAQ